MTHTPQALEPVLQAVRSLGFDPEPIDKAMQPEGSCCSGREAENTGGSCCSPAPVTFGELQTQQVTADGVRTSIRIMQMDCPVEEGMIRKKLDGMSAVKELDFNLMQRVLTVVHAPDTLEPVLAAIRSLGFEPELPDSNGRHAVTEEKKNTGGRSRLPVWRQSPPKPCTGRACRNGWKRLLLWLPLRPVACPRTKKAGLLFATAT